MYQDNDHWKAYGDELRSVLTTPAYNIILDAQRLYDQAQAEAQAEVGNGHQALFELSSGHYQRQFISLWQLFAQSEQFQNCARQLIRKVKKIREQTSFGTVVACTITARYLLDAIHADIETAAEQINVHYFGPYPFINLEHDIAPDFRDERVLILTDVVASGSLLKQITRSVSKLGGIVVGAVSVVVVGKVLLDTADSNEYGRLRYKAEDEQQKPYDLFHLTDFPLDSDHIDAAAAAAANIIRIDPVTIYPKEVVRYACNCEPLFGFEQFLNHVEAANAIDVDFYRCEESRFLTGIRIDRLLDVHGDAIWDRLAPIFQQEHDRQQSYAAVATHDFQETHFKDFIAGRHRQTFGSELTVAMLARRENGVTRFFLLGIDLEALRGKRHIVLLLTAAHTSDTLRELIVNIAMHATPDKITVVCLLNRMGNWTLGFVSRIQQMLSGASNASSQDTAFSFIPVYNLWDFSQDMVRNMQCVTERLMNDFTAACSSSFLVNLIRQDKKHFEYHRLTTRHFRFPATSDMLAEPYTLQIQGQTYISRSSQGKLALICSYVVSTRDYMPIIAELATETIKERLFLYYAILLGDIGYLKLKKSCFEKVRTTLCGRIDDLTAARMAADLTDPDEVESRIRLEAHLLFGLCLLGFRDDYDYASFVNQRIGCGADVADFPQRPRPFISHLKSERWLLSTLMSLHFLRPPAAKKAGNELLLTEIRDYLHKVDQLLTAMDGEQNLPDRDDFKISLNQVKNNLQLLARELGAYQKRKKHQLLRFLQSKLIASRKQHNPIITNLRRSIDEIEKAFERALDNAMRSGEDGDRSLADMEIASYRRIQLDSDFDSRSVEPGMSAAGILREIGLAFGDLMHGESVPEALFKRFAENEENSFSADIQALESILLQVRSDQGLSRQQMQLLRKLYRRIVDDLFDSKSDLIQWLRRYMPPLKQTLANMMAEANAAFQHRQLQTRWDERDIQALLKKAETAEIHVLVEQDLLQEVLKNMCTNVRYQEKNAQPARLYVSFTRETDLLDNLEIEKIQLNIQSAGRISEPRSKDSKIKTTLQKQQEDLQQYGGDLSLTYNENESCVEQVLTLITRHIDPLAENVK